MKRTLLMFVSLAIMLMPMAALAGGDYGTKSYGSSEKMDKMGMKDKMTGTMDVVDLAAHTGKFNTLVSAIKAAELEGVLRGKGPFTVLAPTDAAFAKLPEGTLEDLLKPENKAKLQSILTYHVIPGNVMAKDVMGMSSGKTVNGKDVSFKVDGGKVFADDAMITKTDIKASNGIIHVIDKVILP